MKVTIPKTKNALKILTSTMVENGFSVTEEKPLVTRLSYKGLLFKIGSDKENEYYTHRLKPNGKWMTHVTYKNEVEYTIDFEGLKKELDSAYDAKINRDGLKKAVWFQYSLYQIYLTGILSDIGINKDYVTFYNGNKKTLEFQVRDSLIKYCFSIKVYSNKELEAFISSEFPSLVGNVTITNEMHRYFESDINISDFITDKIKRAHDVLVSSKTASDNSIARMIPLTKETEEKISELRIQLKNKCDQIRQSYPILETFKDDIHDILKETRVK